MARAKGVERYNCDYNMLPNAVNTTNMQLQLTIISTFANTTNDTEPHIHI